MPFDKELRSRASDQCELCASNDDLASHAVSPKLGAELGDLILLCSVCQQQLGLAEDSNHWRCLNDSMWSPIPAVQVMAFRQLHSLVQAGESWAQDLIDMLYLEDDVRTWAESDLPASIDQDRLPTLDSNGTVLADGDTVHVIKDLEVKGAGFTAKRGTAVRNISLNDNPEQIEGRVNGTRIVLLSKYLKKST